jgi:hypothetical protein
MCVIWISGNFDLIRVGSDDDDKTKNRSGLAGRQQRTQTAESGGRWPMGCLSSKADTIGHEGTNWASGGGGRELRKEESRHPRHDVDVLEFIHHHACIIARSTWGPQQSTLSLLISAAIDDDKIRMALTVRRPMLAYSVVQITKCPRASPSPRSAHTKKNSAKRALEPHTYPALEI